MANSDFTGMDNYWDFTNAAGDLQHFFQQAVVLNNIAVIDSEAFSGVISAGVGSVVSGIFSIDDDFIRHN